MAKYYIAYGSNLNMRQMKFRCPGALAVGTGFIKDYELLFKGSKTGSYLTIEEKKGSSVPVAIWKVDGNHERALDRYEGYPSFYYKKEIEIDFISIERKQPHRVKAFVYIMHEDRCLGIPSKEYLQVCLEGYKTFGFSCKYLEDALKNSMEAKHGINNK